jgi:UDP-N-acetylglucosamine:LPS N-acetylglucosamine transferase
VAQPDLSANMLAQMLIKIFADPSSLARRAALAHSMATPNAARKLADVVEQLAEAA